MSKQPEAPTSDHFEIEAKCRKAFLLEDGYGIPSEHPARYTVFRDGFYAAWNRAIEDAAHLHALNAELVEALQEAVDCGMVPVSSASDGGAVRFSRVVKSADRIRAALKKATEAA